MRKFINYISFFFYHAVNWDPLMAIFILYHTIRGEKKYQISTFHPSDLEKYTINQGDKTKASRYEAANYFILEDLFNYFRNHFPSEVNILDAGSGKGRVLVVAAHYGFTQIRGVDFAMELCDEAKKNTDKTKALFPLANFEVLCEDILNYKIGKDETVFFLFNPFNKEILDGFIKNIETSVEKYPRTTYFLYASPRHKEILLEKGYNVEYHVKKLKWFEGIIFKK